MVQASHTNGAPEWMPTSSAGRLGDVLPALDLHPEPVVHQRVPEVLLLLDEARVEAVEVPLARAVGDPAGGAVGLLALLVELLALLARRVARPGPARASPFRDALRRSVVAMKSSPLPSRRAYPAREPRHNGYMPYSVIYLLRYAHDRDDVRRRRRADPPAHPRPAARAARGPVGELVEALGLSQPGVSKHLRVLREARLVDVRPDAQRRIYEVRAEPLAEIDAWLEPYRRCWPGTSTRSNATSTTPRSSRHDRRRRNPGDPGRRPRADALRAPHRPPGRPRLGRADRARPDARVVGGRRRARPARGRRFHDPLAEHRRRGQHGDRARHGVGGRPAPPARARLRHPRRHALGAAARRATRPR